MGYRSDGNFKWMLWILIAMMGHGGGMFHGLRNHDHGKFTVLDDVAICIVAFILCVVLSLAVYFLYLRIRGDRIHRSDLKNHTETTLLIANGGNIIKHNSCDACMAINDMDTDICDHDEESEYLSAYI